jgi:uncharacterized protein (DUF1800 family)
MAFPPDGSLDAALAVTRFGLGARPGEIAEAALDPSEFLHAQIRAEGADQPQDFTTIVLKSTTEKLARPIRALAAFTQRPGAPGVTGQNRAALRAALADPATRRKLAQARNQPMQDEFLARAQLAARTPAGFRERWALFWFNHFTVSVTKRSVGPIAGNFEREAIRPNVFGRFADLLLASSHHPAMLMYLDQTQSVGPNSPLALHPPPPPAPLRPGAPVRPRREFGLNENLAREIMELHSLGVDAGYTQNDVTEFARALTGWSIGGPRVDPSLHGVAYFRVEAHEPGTRRIMGREYVQQGVAQSHAALLDYAASPHTAHHLAVKLARHFVADDPPPALVVRLEKAYLDSDGRLDRIAEALITAPESWEPSAQKFKMPYEFLVSSWRATGAIPASWPEIAPPLNALGQRPYGAPSPKGWEDEAANWATPDAVVKRMMWASDFCQSASASQHDPVQVAHDVLGARLTAAVATAISRAESRSEGLAILLMSPEFQRR